MKLGTFFRVVIYTMEIKNMSIISRFPNSNLNRQDLLNWFSIQESEKNPSDSFIYTNKIITK